MAKKWQLYVRLLKRKRAAVKAGIGWQLVVGARPKPAKTSCLHAVAPHAQVMGKLLPKLKRRRPKNRLVRAEVLKPQQLVVMQRRRAFDAVLPFVKQRVPKRPVTAVVGRTWRKPPANNPLVHKPFQL